MPKNTPFSVSNSTSNGLRISLNREWFSPNSPNGVYIEFIVTTAINVSQQKGSSPFLFCDLAMRPGKARELIVLVVRNNNSGIGRSFMFLYDIVRDQGEVKLDMDYPHYFQVFSHLGLRDGERLQSHGVSVVCQDKRPKYMVGVVTEEPFLHTKRYDAIVGEWAVLEGKEIEKVPGQDYFLLSPVQLLLAELGEIDLYSLEQLGRSADYQLSQIRFWQGRYKAEREQSYSIEMILRALSDTWFFQFLRRGKLRRKAEELLEPKKGVTEQV